MPYESITSDGMGLKYFHYIFKDVKPGQVINIDASYSKSDDKPSVVSEKVSGAGGNSTSYAWIGIGAAMVAIVGGLMFFRRKPVVVRSQLRRAARVETKRAGSRKAQQPAAPAVTTPAAGNEILFCSQCGAKLSAKAAFCHQCGTEIRGLG